MFPLIGLDLVARALGPVPGPGLLLSAFEVEVVPVDVMERVRVLGARGYSSSQKVGLGATWSWRD